jgi:hypothetical protein
MIMQLNNAYKNQGEDPNLQLRTYQTIVRQSPNPNHFHIHRPSVDRLYQFTPEIKDRYGISSAGIYVLSAREGHVSFTYSDRSSMMEYNNLLSDGLHPSLRWLCPILKIDEIKHTQHVTLFFLLSTLFRFDPSMQVHMIDLGCRELCDVRIIPTTHPITPILRANGVSFPKHLYKLFEERQGVKSRKSRQKKRVTSRKSRKIHAKVKSIKI